MTRGLTIPPPARPSWPDATLYEVRPHQESCIMVPQSGDPLQERSGRLEKMSFAAPWRTVDNMGCMVGAGHAQSHRDEPPTFAQGPNARELVHRTPEVHVYLPGEWLAE